MSILRKFFKWHEKQIEWWISEFDINHYGIMWISFFKGMFIATLLLWVLS